MMARITFLVWWDWTMAPAAFLLSQRSDLADDSISSVSVLNGKDVGRWDRANYRGLESGIRRVIQ